MNPRIPLPAKAIRRMSVKRRIQQRKYKDLRKDWWKLPENKFCKVCVNKLATEVHHKYGRIHDLLNMVEHWIPLCHDCHRLAHENPAWARAIGILARKGEWNSIPKTK